MADNNTAPTIVSPNMLFAGEIHYDGDLVIYGKVNGKIVSEGGLVVKENAEVKGDIHVQHLNIQGHLQGNINRAKEVNLAASATVYGDIEALQLAVAKGAHFNGAAKMPQK